MCVCHCECHIKTSCNGLPTVKVSARTLTSVSRHGIVHACNALAVAARRLVLSYLPMTKREEKGANGGTMLGGSAPKPTATPRDRPQNFGRDRLSRGPRSTCAAHGKEGDTLR